MRRRGAAAKESERRGVCARMRVCVQGRRRRTGLREGKVSVLRSCSVVVR